MYLYWEDYKQEIGESEDRMDTIDRIILLFFLSLPVYIVGAYVLANWLTDLIYVEYRIIKNDKIRRKNAATKN
jgi:hypothetical protein|tara:strand:+ start:350 stop:568 length:219 start_codon:yes stop_codon:yes gene_type:complete